MTISAPSLVLLPVLAIVAAPLAARPERAVFDQSALRPVDTSGLMGSPDPLPPLEIVRAFAGLEFVRPVAITHAGDGSDRLFVCDQPGVIHVFPNRDDVAAAGVFLDIRAKTRTKHFEEGLLGLAFHPNYEKNGQFFIYYTVDPAVSVVSRLHVSADDRNRADPASEEVLLRVEQPYGNHNGGGIEFGPDGMLYIPFGDGGAANDPHGNGQNLTVLLGKILRIDVDRRDPGKAYAIPPDNPFAGAAGARFGDGVRGEIWAYGVRNPWRMAFDRANGDLWIGDVGQNLWEEIDIIEKGGNYGWNVREGQHPFAVDAKTTGDAFVEPVFEYARHEGKSITGGIVYRGTALADLAGVYLYADFVTFNVWGLRYDRDAKTVLANSLIARSRLPVTAFGEDENGEALVLAFDAKPGVDVRTLGTGDVFNLSRGMIYRFERRAAGVAARAFPRQLSETGLFSDTATMVPARGLVPYDVNVPLWSDGAAKDRYLALPAAGAIEFAEDGAWKFPVGTVLVKTFRLEQDGGLPDIRLETRLFIHSPRGWEGFTYVWNDAESDAELLDSALRREYEVRRGGDTVRQEWYFPSRSDCNACHTQVAGFVLGLDTRQLNRTHDYGDVHANQITTLAGLGAFAARPAKAAAELPAFPTWGSHEAPVEDLARAYLDVNCSVCHAPGGTGVSRADLRYETPSRRMQAIDAAPGQERLGGADSKIIAPGSPHRSELLLRMLGDGPKRMPSLASSRVDWDAVRVIGAWIEGLAASR